ncbi:MAG: HAD-IIIC family phosphatase [Acidobacteriota bacterium]
MSQLGEILSGLDKDRSLAAYAAAARKLRQLEPLPEFRAAILANHTFDIETTLGVECARRGLGATFYQAGYDQVRQELLDPHSGLDAFHPDAVLISLHLESAFPAITTAPELPDPSDWLASTEAALQTFRARSAAPVFLLDFIPPNESLFDWTAQINASLARMAASIGSVYRIGAAALAASSDLPAWRDARLWYLARAGINPKKFPVLAARIARSFAALRRPAAKCLVLDLDNTLWGGVLGEAGPAGILCADTDYPANAYADFQRAVLALRARGILLAVASKNDEPLVEEAFRTRANMPLRREHISDWEVHWGPKPESLQRIAARLNIGLDSLVFLDDNPAEIDLMKMALPEVRAYRLPPRPEQFVEFLSQLEDFDQLEISAEDLRRAELYELRKKQADMAAVATDLESFYRSLQTTVTAEPAGPANFDRIVQLTGKTNQFNLTTRRHDKAAFTARLASGSELWAFRAADVHGDHGIIAVALLDFDKAVATIDTLLMSCRVIGRTIETAILHFLECRALARGASAIQGEYLPTTKNTPAAGFYGQHGFTNGGGSLWTKDLRTARTACPEWITLCAQS